MNYLLIISSICLNCLAQVFIRKGMLQIGTLTAENILDKTMSMITNIWLWIAMGCFGFSLLLWFVVLSRMPVSFAYPWQSLGIVLTVVAGMLFLGENLDAYRIFGIFIIGFGILVLSKSTF